MQGRGQALASTRRIFCTGRERGERSHKFRFRHFAGRHTKNMSGRLVHQPRPLLPRQPDGALGKSHDEVAHARPGVFELPIHLSRAVQNRPLLEQRLRPATRVRWGRMPRLPQAHESPGAADGSQYRVGRVITCARRYGRQQREGCGTAGEENRQLLGAGNRERGVNPTIGTTEHGLCDGRGIDPPQAKRNRVQFADRTGEEVRHAVLGRDGPPWHLYRSRFCCSGLRRKGSAPRNPSPAQP